MILCIWTAALITSSVWASGNSVVNNSLNYEWIDDNKETLYSIKFVDPLNLNSTIGDISIQDESLFISSDSVLVNYNNCDEKCNKVNTWIHSHILWWSGNSINSNYVTIIAWDNIDVKAWNENATIVWWNDNIIYWWNNSSAVSIWWSGNKIRNQHLWGTLIWWSWNVISSHVEEGVIIWWKDNIITPNLKNVFVWWKNITVNKNNVFVFSNKDAQFKPEVWNAFYINMDKWVWVNTKPEDEWLSVGSAVEIIDMNSRNRNWTCNSGNLWVVASFQGCIIGCTKVWIDQGNKWELLNWGGRCWELFTSGTYSWYVVTYKEDDEPIVVEDTAAHCTTGNANTWNAVLCKNASWELLDLYKNVIFETVLLDSDVPCPEHNLNQCIYRCKQDYHLTWSATDGTLRCYKDCEIPWDKTKKIKHNTTITAYNTTWVSCSNKDYVFPLNTDYIKIWQPLMSYNKYDPIINGIHYYNKASGGKSYESCGNYDHKKILKCNDWTLELIDSSWNSIPNSSEDAQMYKYESCYLTKYDCDTWVYDLTQSQIETQKFDSPKNNGTRKVEDRGNFEWVRWKYTACIDFWVNPDPTKNGESCTPELYHYKFNGCQNGYHTGQGYEDICRKDCQLRDLNNNLVSYVHNEEATWYISKSVNS